jgi:hypothetical protein
MQTMNTDQPAFFPNSAGPHPATAGFYMPTGLDQRKYFYLQLIKYISI